MATATKSARKVNTFRITFTLGDDQYHVTPLACDPAIGSKAYRFAKQTGDQAVYDVHQNGHGPHCECQGFLRWQQPCKHIKTLRAAGMLPRQP